MFGAVAVTAGMDFQKVSSILPLLVMFVLVSGVRELLGWMLSARAVVRNLLVFMASVGAMQRQSVEWAFSSGVVMSEVKSRLLVFVLGVQLLFLLLLLFLLSFRVLSLSQLLPEAFLSSSLEVLSLMLEVTPLTVQRDAQLVTQQVIAQQAVQ
jgi:hypothetical protein